jgi:hypothetical protein
METICLPMLCPVESEPRYLCCSVAAVVLGVLLVVFLMWEGIVTAVVVEVAFQHLRADICRLFQL